MVIANTCLKPKESSIPLNCVWFFFCYFSFKKMSNCPHLFRCRSCYTCDKCCSVAILVCSRYVHNDVKTETKADLPLMSCGVIDFIVQFFFDNDHCESENKYLYPM